MKETGGLKEVYLYKKLKENKVQCQTCSHYCLISENQKGICGVRVNTGGKLYSLVYGKACAANIDPIEKKPFFHFLPNSQSLSIAAVGCNFRCDNCQNYDISQAPKINDISQTSEINDLIFGEELLPKEIVEMALRNNLPSISYTYTEPTIFLEYALDTMKIAKKKSLKNAWVTNGFMSEEAFDLVSPYLDAANVDLKSFSDEFYQKHCGGRLKPVLDTLVRMKKNKIWIEIATLVIPGLNDSTDVFKKIAQFIKENLGTETPWHVTQFCGAISWKLQRLPDTPVETLKKAYEIGKKAGLRYVYTGNVPGISSEDTFCPKCNALAIDRNGYVIHRYDKNGKCPKCKEDLNLILK